MKKLEDIYAVIRSDIPNLHGWCSIQKAERLAQICAENSVTVGVELGVFGGRSLIAMALGCSVRGSGRIHGIDPFTCEASLGGTNSPENDKYWSEMDYEAVALSAQVAIYRLGVISYTQLIRMTSLEAACFYEDESIDVLHQDSNHSEEISTEEVRRWASKIRPGGYWISDDADWSTTLKAQDMIRAAGFVQLEDHVQWKVYKRK